MLRIEARPEPSRRMLLATPFLAVLLTVLSGALLFALLGRDPLVSLHAFFVTPISSLYGLGELGLKATPLILIGIGLAAGFRANVWNIGAEGQLVIGAVCGGGGALWFWEGDAPWVFPLMVVAAVAGGMAWAAIPAFLKTRLEVNEILVSLMLTYVAVLLLSTLVYGPWKDPEGFNFPQSRMFGEAALMKPVVEGTRLHAGILVALAVALAAWLWQARTLSGFALKVVGLAPAAARFAGFERRRTIWLTLLLGGGLAGLAGLFEVAGPIGQLVPQVSPGYGFTAIIVAFLGRLHPLGVVLAAFLVALSYIGGETAQIEAGLPQAVTGVFQGMLLFFLLATDFLVRYRLRPAVRRRGSEGG